MIPFSITFDNGYYAEKLEELRRAYSERYYLVNGSYQNWTAAGWVSSATDVPLTIEQMITYHFFRGMQQFIGGPSLLAPGAYQNFASPCTDYNAVLSPPGSATINNYTDSYFYQWTANHIGGAMVDSVAGTSGWRWATELEINPATDELEPVIRVGSADETGYLPTLFAEEHIFGEWVLDDLIAAFSYMVAMAGKASGVYGDPVVRSEFGSASNTSDEATPQYLFDYTDDDDEQTAPEDLIADAKTDSLDHPCAAAGFMDTPSGWSAGQGNYYEEQSLYADLADYYGLPAGTLFYKWAAEVEIARYASGGDEAVEPYDNLVGKASWITQIDIYYADDFPSYSLGKTTTTGAPTVEDGYFKTGGSYGSATLPAWIADLDESTWGDVDWGDEPTYTPPDPEDPDYAAKQAEYLLLVARLAVYKSIYGDWGAEPGFAWAKFAAASRYRRSYMGALLWLDLTYGNPVSPISVESGFRGMGGIVTCSINEPEIPDPPPEPPPPPQWTSVPTTIITLYPTSRVTTYPTDVQTSRETDYQTEYDTEYYTDYITSWDLTITRDSGTIDIIPQNHLTDRPTIYQTDHETVRDTSYPTDYDTTRPTVYDTTRPTVRNTNKPIGG